VPSSLTIHFHTRIPHILTGKAIPKLRKRMQLDPARATRIMATPKELPAKAHNRIRTHFLAWRDATRHSTINVAGPGVSTSENMDWQQPVEICWQSRDIRTVGVGVEVRRRVYNDKLAVSRWRQRTTPFLPMYHPSLLACTLDGNLFAFSYISISCRL